EETVIKYGFIALGVILVICIVAFAIISFLPNNILSIGDEKITEEEFDYHYFEQANLLYQQILQYYPDVSLEVFMMSEYQAGMTYHEFAKQLALERISEIQILLDLAEQENYVYDEAEFEDSKQNFKNSFTEYADQMNMSLDEAAKDLYGCKFDVVQSIYEKTWISSKYQDDLLREYETEVDEGTALEYYLNFEDDLDRVTLKQLFISTYDTETQQYYDDEAYAAAKTRAEGIFARVLGGEDYDALIMELSEDPSVEETLGEYESKKSEIGLDSLAEWAFSKDRAADDMDMVETEIGFHIVKFISRTGFEDVLDEVKNNIAYGEMLKLLAERRAMPEYEVGYYNAFSTY
ncbi:MAG: peptidylprolyl isomerase, partial [Clostridia bacterium]|nr:peptidylprolyl isomerase [Clostridia bacterium]